MKQLASEEEALVTCPVDEVQAHRARLKLIRHLLGIPETLRNERSRLQELIDGVEPV